MFWRARYSLLRAGCLPCSLDVLHGGLGINVQCCNFLSEKLKNYFQLVKFYNFLSLNPWIRVQNWIRSRIETNADPQHRLRYRDDFNCGSYSNFPNSFYFLSWPCFRVFSSVLRLYHFCCRFKDSGLRLLLWCGYLSIASKVRRNYEKIAVKNQGSDTYILYKNRASETSENAVLIIREIWLWFLELEMVDLCCQLSILCRPSLVFF